MGSLFVISTSTMMVGCMGPIDLSGSGTDAIDGTTLPDGSAPKSILDSEEAKFLDLINTYRAQNGLSPLALSATLSQAAQWMSDDMASNDFLDHTDTDGRDPFTRMQDFGYSANSMGENVAAGNADAQATFTQWKNSPPHNANMLNATYQAIGIGRAQGGTYGWYWTNDFGSKVK
jgi:uncharacterized protein YkwD